MGADRSDFPLNETGDTQVVDVRELDLRDDGVSRSERRTAPPPLPASALSSSAPAPSPAPALAPRGRSNGFYIGVIFAALFLSIGVGFAVASTLRRPPPEAASPAPRVITIAPVEVK